MNLSLAGYAVVALCVVGIVAPAFAQSDDAAEPTAKTSTRKPAKKAAAKPAAAKTKAGADVPGGAQAVLVATFSDWSAYTAQTGKSKICYALSQPKSRTPANLKDTPGYLFVSFRPAENVRNEVATVLGFPAKDGGAAEVSIAGTNYALVTKGQNGWIKNPADEPQAIQTMSKGQAMTVTVTSGRGNKTGDRYSLNGFAQALDRARKECP